MKQFKCFCLVLLLLLTGGCASGKTEPLQTISVVLEEGAGFEASSYVCQTGIGEDASFIISLQDGYQISEIDCGKGTSYSLTEEGDHFVLTLKENRYTKSIRIRTELAGDAIYYYANGGIRLDQGNPEEALVQLSSPKHLRHNTSTGYELFSREGYTLMGWNTKSDGSGTYVGLGSRTDWEEGLTLYAQWKKWADPSAFTIEASGEGLTITGYHGTESFVAVPEEIEGKPVWQIAEGAFRGSPVENLILPRGLRRVEKEAFLDTPLKELWLFDSLLFISDYCIGEDSMLHTLHINAATAPVYSNNYFASFADKFDRLLSIKDDKKIVLFSGSSTRFGYDSAKIDETFRDYTVVNMGVFAYTNAYPQLLLIKDCMKEGDVLVDSPEFDAALRQFCTHKRVEDEFFAMCEANYDLVSRLDLGDVGNTFAALTEYLNNRIGMEAKSCFMSPSDYDEDGKRSMSPSYNEYGDYILYRPNASDLAPIYGLPVDYTKASFPKEQFLDPINAVYKQFLDKGILVFFTYAPRNRLAISPESTPQAREELDQWFRENLVVPVLGDVEDSLYSGTYLYGTDNHLSTEGVAIRTDLIINELQPYLANGEEE